MWKVAHLRFEKQVAAAVGLLCFGLVCLSLGGATWILWGFGFPADGGASRLSLVGTLGLLLLLGAGLVAAGTTFAWLLARHVIAPVRELTRAACRIGRSHELAMLPRVTGSREIIELSAALRALLRRIGTAERRLDANDARSSQALQQLQAELAVVRRTADTDSLTGLYNRRAFLGYAEDAMTYYQRYHRSIAIIIADIDYFKRVNDTYGHPAGDEVIRTVADILRDGVRSTDRVGRLGGEEFILLLREVDEEGVLALAERLRQAVRTTTTRSGVREIRVTMSLGAALVNEGDEDVASLIERADAALYEAKRRGRDRTVLQPVPALPQVSHAA